MQSATGGRAHEILEVESGAATLTVRRWRGEGTPLDELIAVAGEAGDLDEVNRLEAWCWLDGVVAGIVR